MGIAHNTGQRRQPLPLGFRLAGDDDGRAAIIQTGGIPRGHLAVLVKCGGQFSQLLQAGQQGIAAIFKTSPDALVLANSGDRSFTPLDLHGHNFSLETAAGCRLGRLFMAAESKFIHFRPGHFKLLGDKFSGIAHGPILKATPEAVL